jgi:deoxyribodipyrimidine photo-lyase
MADNARVLADRNVRYIPYVEPERGAAKGLLKALASDAAVVVTDAFPTFFLPRMVAAAAKTLPIRLESVDSNGVIPLGAIDKAPATAHVFRRFLQKNLVEQLGTIPLEDPLAEPLPPGVATPDDTIFHRWPIAPRELLAGDETALASLPIDHSVPVTSTRGGEREARRVLRRFLDELIPDYAVKRNRPEEEATSGLSPYLHFGHISAHEVFLEVMRRERWSPEDVVPPTDGRRAGWWAVSEPAEAFLDQLVTWRELGFQFCHHRIDHGSWESLPDWARTTLELHAEDEREYLYSVEEFAAAATHDPLWNAAQTQLVREGTIHNYLRMLWGKKILEWTEHPRQALEIMFELNNRFALDGRDPNSVTGICWVLGRHDRPWGPERPIFGKVRYMSSANTARKFPVKGYVERFTPRRDAS